MEGTGQVTHGAELYIGDVQNANTSGRLEIIGSSAGVQIGQLENAAGGTIGVRETIQWQADAGGIAPLVVTGAGPLAPRVFSCKTRPKWQQILAPTAAET